MVHNVQRHSRIEEVTFKPAPLLATGRTGSEWLKKTACLREPIFQVIRPLTILLARCNRGLFFREVWGFASIKCDAPPTDLEFRCAWPFGRGEGRGPCQDERFCGAFSASLHRRRILARLGRTAPEPATQVSFCRFPVRSIFPSGFTDR